MTFEHKESSVYIPIQNDEANNLLISRMEKSWADMRDNMTRGLYGDERVSRPPLTVWERFMRVARDNRLTNAWLVLLGREDIDRGYW